MSRRETSFCVYTTMIGRYENLNEQPIAKSSGVPFICLTDDETLVSDSWTIRLVTPCFPSDPVRSQREVKIRPQLHLPDFPASFYIDNSILLTETPELIWERYGTGASGISLPSHSDRESVLDEFLAVTAAGLDDTARVYEQLNHYQLDNYRVLEERPHWTAFMLRDHQNAALRRMQEIWLAHVHRYSRRDQLSFNTACNLAGVTPDAISLNAVESWCHRWPFVGGRDARRGMRSATRSLASPLAQMRMLEQELQDRLAQSGDEAAAPTEALQLELAKLRHIVSQSSISRGRPQPVQAPVPAEPPLPVEAAPPVEASPPAEVHLPYESAAATPDRPIQAWARKNFSLRRNAKRIRRLPFRLRQIALRIGSSLGRPSMQDTPAQEANGPVAEQAESASGDYAIAGSRRIYVAAGDRRGMELIAKGGDLNPNRLKVWNRLLSAASWTHVIDVGANYGEMLVNMNVDAATSVTAIEPNADILPLLHKTLAEAGIAATILPVATGDRNGVAKFFVNRNWSGMSRLAGTDTGNESATDFMIVPMLTLREIIGSEAANARLLVKIDVEGFERSVLAGLSDSLGQMDSFAALTEVLHLGDDDVRDILTSFDVYLYDIAEDKFVHVVPPELSRFKELRADPRHYWNDVVVRRRGDPAIGSR